MLRRISAFAVALSLLLALSLPALAAGGEELSEDEVYSVSSDTEPILLGAVGYAVDYTQQIATAVGSKGYSDSTIIACVNGLYSLFKAGSDLNRAIQRLNFLADGSGSNGGLVHNLQYIVNQFGTNGVMHLISDNIKACRDYLQKINDKSFGGSAWTIPHITSLLVDTGYIKPILDLLNSQLAFLGDDNWNLNRHVVNLDYQLTRFVEGIYPLNGSANASIGNFFPNVQSISDKLSSSETQESIADLTYGGFSDLLGHWLPTFEDYTQRAFFADFDAFSTPYLQALWANDESGFVSWLDVIHDDTWALHYVLADDDTIAAKDANKDTEKEVLDSITSSSGGLKVNPGEIKDVVGVAGTVKDIFKFPGSLSDLPKVLGDAFTDENIFAVFTQRFRDEVGLGEMPQDTDRDTDMASYTAVPRGDPDDPYTWYDLEPVAGTADYREMLRELYAAFGMELTDDELDSLLS